MINGTIKRMIPNAAPTRFYDLFLKGSAGTAPGRFGVRGYLSGDDITPADLAQPDHRWRSGAASASLSSLVSDRLYADARLSYSESTIERLAKGGSPVTPASSRLRELSLRAELTSYTEGETTFLEGFAFEFPEIEDRLFSPTLIPLETKDSELDWSLWLRAQGTAAGGLLGYDMGLHGDGILLLGGKPFFYSVQPRLTLSYHLSPTWIVRASFGIYTQNLVAVSNEDDLISLFDAWLYLPEELRPEVARHYVLGLEGTPTDGLAASIQVYRKEYPALTVYNPAKVFPQDPDYLNGTGLASGAELLLRYGSELLELYVSYGIASVTLTEGALTYAPRYDRRHTVKGVGTIHLHEGLDFTLKWEYGSGYPFTQGAGYYERLTLPDLDRDPFPAGPHTVVQALGQKNAARLPPYHRLDAGIEYRLALSERVTVNIGASVINLYNQKNILYYDRKTGATDYMIPFFPTVSAAVEF